MGYRYNCGNSTIFHGQRKPKSNKMAYLKWSVGLLLLLSVGCGRREKVYTFAEAERSLKVLNSDLTNFLTAADNLDEFKALKFLYNQESAPLPVKKGISRNESGSFDFAAMAGIYTFDRDSSQFRKTGDASDIRIFFSTEQGGEFCFHILNYRDQIISSKPAFPIEAKAELLKAGKSILSVNHRATISDDLPETLDLKIDGDYYQITGQLRRTKEVKDGTLTAQLVFATKLQTQIKVDFEAKISYSRQGFYFNDLSFTTALFGHKIVGKIDYAGIDPTVDDYAKSFNSHSKIIIYESPRAKVGEIVLGPTSDKDQLEFFIKFENNKLHKITDYIPLLEKFYNFKY